MSYAYGGRSPLVSSPSAFPSLPFPFPGPPSLLPSSPHALLPSSPPVLLALACLLLGSKLASWARWLVQRHTPPSSPPLTPQPLSL
eukprot:3848195-Rhodomonas_salina.1